MALKISRILHAGYIFEYGQTTIAFDPIFENPFSRNCNAFPAVRFEYEQIKKLKLSAVFISHYHDDHCSFESLDFLDRSIPIYIYCVFEEILDMLKELGFTRVYSLELNKAIAIGDFEITPHPALDIDVDSIFHIKAGGCNVLNVVDSWIDPETLKKLSHISPWHMILWPFQTMREIEVLTPSRASKEFAGLPAEWSEQLKTLNPKYVVPSSCQFVQESWSWYNHALFPISYRYFQEEIKSILPDSKVVRLNPGVSVILTENAIEKGRPLQWIKPLGEQDLDYVFEPVRVPSGTAEIAKHFDPLTEAQVQRVYKYCEHDLLAKYRSLVLPQDSYFKKQRHWRLSLYDHQGLVIHFHYACKENQIELAKENKQTLSWQTEVPIAKLYNAIELGESLTSMYMRINEDVFSPEIEKEIKESDVLEDPLIRCLFHGVFGAYQRAQLKKLAQTKAEMPQ